MSGAIKTNLRGVLIQDPRLTSAAFSASLSSLSEAGSLPGVPQPQQATSLILEASGTQSAGADMEIRTHRGGHPDGSAAFVWRYEGDTDWRGRDGPHLLSAWEFVARSLTAGDYERPHIVTLENGVVICAVEYQRQAVKIYRRSPSSNTWGTADTLFDDGSPSTYGLHPCLLVHPSGMIQVYTWREVSGRVQVRMHYSRDGGESWTLGQKSCLSTAITISAHIAGRLRAGILNNNILLIAEIIDVGASENQIWQYASIDFGATFQSVSQLTGVSRAFPDVIPTSSGLLVVYLAYRAATAPNQLPYYRRLGSAFDALTAVDATAIDVSGSLEWGTMSGTAFSSGDLAGCRDEDGILYLMGRDHDGGTYSELYLVRSTDDGETWEAVGMDGDGAADGAAVWAGRDAGIYPRDFAVAPHCGRVLVAHRFVGGVGSDSLCVGYLGGYTTVTMPLKDQLTDSPNDQTGWLRTWLPFDEPDLVGTAWTKLVVGTPTTTLGSGGVLITGTTGDTVLYYHGPTTTFADGVIGNACLKVVSGSGYLSVRCSDGTNAFQVRVEVSTTQIIARDLFGGTLATVTTGAGTTGVELRLAVGGASGKAAAWWRASGTASDREWTEIGTWTGLTSTALTTSLIGAGNLSAVATEVYLSQLFTTWGSHTGTNLHSGQDNPSELLPRPYSALPMGVDGGLMLKALDGPSFRADEWQISPAYSYGISQIQPDVAASPRRPWRSTDTTQQEIVWEVGEDLADTHGFMDRVTGIYLGGINFRTAALYGRDSGGSWTKLVDIDAATGMTGLSFVRAGAQVRPGSGSANAAHYLPMNVLAGGSFFNGLDTRKILTNTDGTWGGTRACNLLLEDYDTADAASGSGGQLWSPEVTAIFESPAAAYNAFKLVIPATGGISDGYFQIGVCMIGPVIVLGDDYNLGRSLGISGSWTRTTTRGGVDTFRSTAPVGRSADVDWTEGIDVSGITRSTPDPNHILGRTGGTALAAEGSTPYLVPGLYTFLRGAMSPLVYLPSFSLSSGSTCLSNRQRMLYGRILTESLRQDSVLGEEWADNEQHGEMFRVSKLRIEEIT